MKILSFILLLFLLNPLVALAGNTDFRHAQQKSDERCLIMPAAIFATGLSILAVDEEVRRFSQRNRLEIENKGHLVKHSFTAALPVFAAIGYIGGNEKAQLTSRALLRGIVVNAAVTAGLKEILGRSRPNRLDDGAHEFKPFSGNRALPSGHTSHSFVVATILSEIYGEDYGWVTPVVYGAATFVAYSRIDGNKHWVSDLILGAALGHVIGKWSVSKETRKITPVVFNNGGVGLKANFRF